MYQMYLRVTQVIMLSLLQSEERIYEGLLAEATKGDVLRLLMSKEKLSGELIKSAFQLFLEAESKVTAEIVATVVKINETVSTDDKERQASV